MKTAAFAIFLAMTLRAYAGAQRPADAVPPPPDAAATASAADKPAEGTCECLRCIAVYGDTRSHHDIHAKIAALINARRPEAVFHTGDLVNSGRNKADWEKFAEITKSLRESASFYAVMGNHESGGEAAFKRLFPYPGNGRWYGASLHGIRFLMLDSLSPLEAGSEQFKWLEAELGTRAGEHKFSAVILHTPLLSSGEHGNKKGRAAKDLQSLLERYKVSIMIAGHDHDYERLERNGTVYIVTGGGGATLRPLGSKSPYSKIFSDTNNYGTLSVCGGTLKGEFFNIKDKLIDSFEIRAGSAAALGAE